MGLSRKQIREAEDVANAEEDLYETNPQSLEKDYESLQQHREMTGDFIPDDLFKYKYLRLIPRAQESYDSLVDKDAVLANVTGTLPDIDETSFINQTIELFKQIFVVEKEFVLTDEEGTPLLNKAHEQVIVKKKIPDETYLPIIRALEVMNKSKIVLSRAKGSDREAILDRTTTLQKGIRKENPKRQGFLMGSV